MSQNDNVIREPLAIVGMACRFPGGANSLEAFWRLLIEKRSGIVPVPDSRWNRERFYHPNPEIPGKMVTKWAGFVDNHDRFDAQFFGISPREALRMDPQQRWLLETAWEALEDAGMPPTDLRGSNTSVFVGIASNDYANVAQSDPKNVDVHTNSGSTLSIASNRIAYLFDFKGAAVSVDTACSSALVAVNLACESIWSGQSDMALAGGVNALLTPDASIGFSKASMLSPSGQCFAFDARANGYVRGEGAGMIVLKPLSKALADGDPVYCTVRAAVINQDGNTSSMTVPGVETQAEMLRIAYRQAGMTPRQVRYMEAHGTGTPVGDPIETRALGQVLAEGREKGDWCLIGSVKTNIGHLESGSGVAGLIKAALVLYHDTVPASLNFETPNPLIPFEEYKLKVVTETRPLPHWDGYLPVAAVNSFGFGGTNAHIVLEAMPGPAGNGGPAPAPAGGGIAASSGKQQLANASRPCLLPISGRGEGALRDGAVKWRDFLRKSPMALSEIAAGAGVCREHHENGLVVIGRDREEIAHSLTEWLAGAEEERVIAGRRGAEVHPLVFVFTGQGAQWWRMGQDLMKREPLFFDTLREIDRHLTPLAGWSLIEEMSRDEPSSRIHETNIAQPSIFGLQVALAELWKSWGIVPSKVAGHSVGEVAAAYVAGAYSLGDAVKVIFHRSRLQGTTGGRGRMAAVGLSEAEAKKAIAGSEDRVQVAVINSPALVTLAGDRAPLEEIVGRLEAEGRFVRWLRIDYAFHTHQMDPIREELLEALADIEPMPARIPFVSTVTGGQMAGEKLDARYWWRNVREPVLFAPAIIGMVRGGDDAFLELGPHPALANPIQECLSEQGRKGVYFSSLARKTDESQEMLRNLAKLHLHGYRIDWKAVNQARGRKVKLPGYSWQRESYWLESPEGRYLRTAPEEHPLLGLRKTAPKPAWRFELDTRIFTWLDDHRFWDSIVFPASGYGEIGLAIARKLFPGENYAVEDLEMQKALFVSDQKAPTVEVVFDPDTREFKVFSATGDRSEWDLNAQGVLRKQPMPSKAPADFEAIKAGLEEYFDHERYYSDYAKAGYQFRPLFQHLQGVWRKRGESFAEIVAPEGLLDSLPAFHFHPAVLDACFHTVKGGQVAPEGAKAKDYFYLPAAIRSIRLLVDKPPRRLWGHAHVNTDNDREYILADIDVFDDEGRLVAEIHGFRADRVEQNEGEELDRRLYQEKWEIVRLKGTRIEGSAALASPPEILSAAEASVSAQYEGRRLHEYYEKFVPRLETAARRFIVNAFLDLGWSPQPGQLVTVTGHMRRLNIADRHRRLVHAQLTALEEGGWLKKMSEEEWEVIQAPEKANGIELLDDLERDFPRFASEVALQRAGAPHLAGILSGEIDPLEKLFPGGSSQTMERFYREGADFPVLNSLVREAVEKAIAQVPPHRAIRVLEIGAGTGSLTQQLLPVFPAGRTEYVFTDTGPLFLAGARDKFEERYPFVEYASFDCERDPGSQGLQAHGYDIVLASNVLHATADLKETLKNCRRCLAPDGLLMFLEVTWRRAALDNVFGLLPGWWRFTDTGIRQRSALLSRSDWENLLKECGFRETVGLLSSPDPKEDNQVCFLARAPHPVETVETGNRALRANTEPGEGAAESDEAPGVFVILSDYSGVGSRLEVALGERGVPAVLVSDDLGEFRDRLERLSAAGTQIRGVVHALCLDHPRPGELDAARLDLAQDTGVRSAHQLVKILTAREWAGDRPKVFFLTRGAVAAVPQDSLPGLASTPLAGLLRVARNEHADFSWIQIDLDPASENCELRDLADELLLTDDEQEVAYRGHHRHVRRVHRVKAEELPPRLRDAAPGGGEALPFRLQIDKPGILSHLSLNETVRRDPGPDEVEIRVKAGGVNFRDVMKALGMYPGNPVDLKWFGDDFSGEVVRVGAGVTDLKPGDEVAGMAPYCFRSYVTAHRRLVFRKPAAMSHAEAATLPTVFLTAHYAIHELARMRKGESILIHAGTGGVGQAAIQVARHLGLEIFATAGTGEKRDLLRQMGADHVLDSRTLEFADRIVEITGGRGVDAVLNSLAGDFIPKNLSVLARFGRYLEIGKVDVYGNSRIGLAPLRNNVSFFVIDLAQHLEDRPEFVAEMFSSLERNFSEGIYRPLPNTVFPITEVVEAFRYMAAGKHIGKIVLDFDVPEIPVAASTESGHRFRNDGAWLIAGGAGGFGLELAAWLAGNGARHFALLSRSGPKEEALPKIEALRAMGCRVMDMRGDVTRREDMDRIVGEIQSGPAPLTGVIHGAMALDDDFIGELDRERFDRALLPKMLGAWNLHQATRDIPLEYFLCFSSFSAVIGAVKQSNYNAGNLFLDQLAHYRRAQGLPALTFNWGAIAGAGFVERNEKTRQYLEMVGLGATDLEETLSLFSQGILTDAIQLGAARADWQALARFSPLVGGSKVFQPVVPRSGGAGADSVAARILDAPADKRLAMVEELVAAQVAAVLGTDVSRIDKDTPLTNLGLDSLMAIELVNRIEEKLGMSMPMGSVLNGPNIRDLAAPVLEKMLESAGDLAGAAEGGHAPAPFVATGEMPEAFPLSEGQRALWFLYRLAPKSSAYNLVFSGKFRPLLDIEAMKKAFALLFERHPELDASFATQDGEPVQIIRKGGTIDFREHDCRHLNDAQIRQLISEHANRPFDLDRGPVARLELFRTADQAHVGLLCMHHIISDAWSVAVIIQDLIEYYFSVKAGRTPRIEPLPASYADFVRWEQAHLESPAGDAALAYWREQLAGAPVALDLPTDRPRPAIQSFNGGVYGFRLDEALTEAVNDLSKAQNVTQFTTLLSGFQILLHRFCQQEDIVIGMPLAGRNQPELRGVAGYFVNPVPIRSDVSQDPTVEVFLSQNRERVNGALEHQQYPLARIVDRLKIPRDPGRSPLFQATFQKERVPGVDQQGIAVFLIGQGGHTFHVGDLSMETVDLTTRQAQFELTLVMEEAGGRLFGCWQYNRDLFDRETIEQLNSLYEHILWRMAREPGARISEIGLLDEPGQRALLDSRNATDRDFPRDRLLHELVAESAARHPDSTAVVCGDEQFSYGEVNRWANGLAKKLIAAGVVPGDTVGVLVNRSAGMTAALLGVLKAGAAYVPLDPEFPRQRLDLMLRDAAPKALLISKRVAPVPEGDWATLVLESVEPSADPPAIEGVTPESLAYILYTSGSTGTPKGVEIPHRAAVNFLTAMLECPGLEAKDRLLAVTTLSFDISLLEIFLPLLAGAATVVADREDVKDGRRLANLLHEEDITVMQATPATWRMLLDSGWEGRSDLRIFCGGEALSRDLANVLVNSASEVWNLYGPTETTVWSAVQRIEEGEGAVAIGRPIANTRIYVLDAAFRLVPDGFAGELWIGGDGLARGYRNRPDLTEAAFVEIDLPNGRRERLYRTGDLGRWTRDGALECLGRIDFQVKVRGLRIELGDIEVQLRSHPAIDEAVVAKREDLPGGEGLVAYLVCRGKGPDIAELRAYLAERLPAGHIPAFFEKIESFPLTPNRKIDRRRLPAPKFGSGTGDARIPPASPTEKKLWEIFHHHFETGDFGVTNNFFELGGDSLMALRIVVEVSEAFHRELPVEAFLRHPTVEQLARYLELSEGETVREWPGADGWEIAIEDLDHLAIRDAGGDLPALDAAALATIPETLVALADVSRDLISERLLGGHPLLTNCYHLPQGTIGVIMIPCFENDLYKDPSAARGPIVAALEMAARAGARTVSLTGILPSATDHGRLIAEWSAGRSDLPVITTGDATRAATVVRSVEGILARTGREPGGETLAVVGLGSIGYGALRLMLEVLPHPKKLILCDPYRNDEQLARVRDEIRAAGFAGEADVVANGGALPVEVYRASLIVATTNLPGILDIDALDPGALVVDYSFPPVFRVGDAIRRFSERGDILFTTGGELDTGAAIRETIYLPEGAEHLAEGMEGRFLRFLAGREKSEITGCVLVSLLTGQKESVRPTLGPLKVEDALSHYRYLDDLGMRPARLQMQGYFPAEEKITAFCSRAVREPPETSKKKNRPDRVDSGT